MRELDKLKAYRNKSKDIVRNVYGDIEKINSRKDIISDDKKNLKENTVEKGLKKLDGYLPQLQEDINQIFGEASEDLEKATRVDKNKIPVHESIMLDSKTDEELLNLYRNRHYDKVQRAMISDAISQRVDSMANPSMSSLANDFIKLDRELRPNLPEEEFAAHEKMDKVNKLNTYTEKLKNEMAWNKTKLEKLLNGSDLSGEEKVALRMVNHELNEIEESINPYIETDTDKGE